MASPFAFDSNSSYGCDFYDLFVPIKSKIGGVNGVVREKSELAKVPLRVGKKRVSDEKAEAALKSHSEAERRRRERINAHLAALRALIPSTDKMDKATLLAGVINQVKELKKTAAEASKGFLIPMDADELRIEPFDSGAGDEILHFRASLSCDYRPELLTDLRQALDALQLKLVSAEISTLGARVKSEFVLTSCKERIIDDANACQLLAASIHQSLTSVLDSSFASAEYSPRTILPNKKRRISSLESVSSSS